MIKSRRIKRHYKIRHQVKGTSDCPRISVFRSNQHIYAQLVDDQKGVTLFSSSDFEAKKGPKSDLAFEVGKTLAEKAVKKGIKKAVFDRGGYLYHGRVAKLAAGAREGGLKF